MTAKKDAGRGQTSLNSYSGGEAISRAKGTAADGATSASPAITSAREFDRHLRTFRHQRDGAITDTVRSTRVEEVNAGDRVVRRYIGEFWTAKQRNATSLHEVSYRACFKPQLPRFFIDRLTAEGDRVYDPFGGRGTTIIEATLAGRRGISNDVNPLSEIFASPRLHIPGLSDIERRLREIPLDTTKTADIDLSMFYHAETLGEIVSLREYLQERRATGKEDEIDRWIRMVATTRLTGHSPGFFSVYTLPPNQAVSQDSQKKINRKRNQVPGYKDVKKLILKKSRQLIRGITPLEFEHIAKYGDHGVFLNQDARHTAWISDNAIALTVTSPPFLDIVQYPADNWLRCWFNAIDAEEVSKKITMARTVEQWAGVMAGVFKELYRITRAGGWVAFEVGEVRKGSIRLDEVVVPLGIDAGFTLFGILINDQEFTKTANIWGVSNNTGGTNTNRIVLFTKQGER